MPNKVQIFGPGCSNCEALVNNTYKAIVETGLDIEIEKIETVEEIIKAGIISVPALMIDDQIVCTGQVATVDEIKQWLLRSE